MYQKSRWTKVKVKRIKHKTIKETTKTQDEQEKEQNIY
jgi:hypothetical protein